MKLSQLEECVLGYFLSVEAINVTVDGRFYRREEFVHIFEDRIFYSTQKFGHGSGSRHSNVANRLVDKLIEERALSTSHDKYSGISHQFDAAKYRAVIRGLIDSNEYCQRSGNAGPQFWEQAFANLERGNGLA